MARDDALAQRSRDDLAGVEVAERRMLGGLAFVVGGHMVAGIHKCGAFFRVGKPNGAAALRLPGTARMDMAGRPMPGMIALTGNDAGSRTALMAPAGGFVQTLPPK